MGVIDIKKIAKTEQLFAPGHRACAGCGATIIIRQVLSVAGKDTVVGFATGCMEVVSTIFPYTAWEIPFLHVAFENVAAAISGVETAYRALKKKGKIKKKINFIAFGGDGGTYDIGLQALSGAMERGHDMLYICYDNGAYMNTGIQRSSATPFGAHTTTSPAGKKIPGKMQWRKDLTEIMASHGVPYVAQASPAYYQDLMQKVEKALSIEGPTFIDVLSPCPLGWYYATKDTIKIAKLAVETKYWPLYEVENGVHRVTVKPRKFKPVEEWLKMQGRFRHLFKEENKWMIEYIQKELDKRWERLLKLEEAGL
ncbi:MAG TPA: pyruvate synthase subunit beta [candidate division WOR-3 bacterium]|uniref:Pyruvate synthase subunit beta n=1 Tax=candidate division WOR-3 bacterium TaxID=2052148 RepID=A0A7C0ZLV3_UNCW3|nr:pyruvate synthase subunit beta [candidate division WOR-3 bacterium]